MLQDRALNMSDAQVVTASGNSTDYLDLRGSRLLGGGERMFFFVHTKDGSTAAPTFTAALVGADDSGFSTNKITIATTAATALTTGAYQIFALAISPHTAKRYYRVEYTISGGTGPSVTVTAGITKTVPTTPMVY